MTMGFFDLIKAKLSGNSGGIVSPTRSQGQAATPTSNESMIAPDSRPQRIMMMTSLPMTPRFIPRSVGGAVTKESMGRGGFRGFSFDMLRLLAYQSPLLEAVISARLHGVKHFAKRYSGGKDAVGFRIVHEEQHNPEVDVKKLYPDAAERCKSWQRKFNRPHPIYCPSFSDFCLKLTSDILEINRPAVEVLYDIEAEEMVMQFQPVDGALILPTLNYLEQFREEHPNLFGFPSADPLDQLFQVFWNSRRLDLSSYEHVVVRDGAVENAYRPGRLILCPMNTVTNINFAGFPPSLVERAAIGVLAFDNAFAYNSSYFTRGSMVECILGISADFEESSFVAFQQQLQDNFTGVAGAWSIPMVRIEDSKDIQAIRIKENNRDMQFDVFLNSVLSLVLAVFRMHPSNINYTGRGNDGKALFDRNQEYEIGSSVEEGQHSLLDHIALVANQVIHQTDPDLMFEWVNLNRKDAEKEARIVQIELGSWRSIDSVVQENGGKPYKQWWSECPANPAILPYVAQQNQPQVDPAKAMAPGNGGNPGFGQEDFGQGNQAGQQAQNGQEKQDAPGGRALQNGATSDNQADPGGNAPTPANGNSPGSGSNKASPSKDISAYLDPANMHKALSPMAIVIVEEEQCEL
jgi:hypothetical protein